MTWPQTSFLKPAGATLYTASSAMHNMWLLALALRVEDALKQNLADTRAMCAAPLDSRDYVAVVGMALAPLVLVLEVGGIFGLACLCESQGPGRALCWAALASVFWSALVYLVLAGYRHRTSKDMKEGQGPGLFPRLKTYAASLNLEADRYRDPDKRAAFCQIPWLAAASVLGLEMSVAAASGRLLPFLQAIICTFAAATTSGAVLGLAVYNELPGPPAPKTHLETAAASVARCPAISMCVSCIFALALPVLEQVSPSARDMQEMGTGKLLTAEQHLAETAELRCKLCRRTNKVLSPAAQLERPGCKQGSATWRRFQRKHHPCQVLRHAKCSVCRVKLQEGRNWFRC